MPKMIQIRNVPDDLHARLKERASVQGLSLSDYLKRELDRTTKRGSWAAFEEWYRRQEPAPGETDVVKAIHEAREEREERLWSLSTRRP
ncbi:MAG: hypothetical protein SFV18_11760 [Bryobacteraceae bacterium]|nr:hypothetical protein [Bryobacteraceae bacterium]